MSALKIAEGFQRGGGAFTFAEWNAMAVEDQVAATEARSSMNHELAALIAFYLQNPVQMMETIGGEDAAVRAALQGSGK